MFLIYSLFSGVSNSSRKHYAASSVHWFKDGEHHLPFLVLGSLVHKYISAYMPIQVKIDLGM